MVTLVHKHWKLRWKQDINETEIHSNVNVFNWKSKFCVALKSCKKISFYPEVHHTILPPLIQFLGKSSCHYAGGGGGERY